MTSRILPDLHEEYVGNSSPPPPPLCTLPSPPSAQQSEGQLDLREEYLGKVKETVSLQLRLDQEVQGGGECGCCEGEECRGGEGGRRQYPFDGLGWTRGACTKRGYEYPLSFP